ncbi:sialoadhesin-like [Toxotes jaculatrix]|uniref:sialoadhesin-like n=1 Tax=Toxotes jaculatrix TaxID=941984 RepID=UPI001B3A8565|nr:sialoadhesin-like [Toxotes jaculatrix]
MSLTAAWSGFVVFVLCVSVVHGQDGWGVTYSLTQICALKGSTVEIRCSYRYPPRMNGHETTVERRFWFTKFQDEERVDVRTDSAYAGRVQYHCGEDDCTLTIRDLRESDSAQYKFMFITNQPGGAFTGSPGVTLSVTGLQVKVSSSSRCFLYSCTWSDLRCSSSCDLPNHPSYIWYKNGQKTGGKTNDHSGYFYYEDSVSCAVEGHEDLPSPSVCVYGDSCNRVTYTDRSICAFKGSSVDISCSYNSYRSVTSKFWFNAECYRSGSYCRQPVDLSEDSLYAGRVQVFETTTGRSTLRITDLRESDSAEYRFKFKTQSSEWQSGLPGTTLTVTEPRVQVQVIWSSTGPTLVCHSSCLLPGRSSFVWYENGNMIQGETSHSLRRLFDPEDSFSCAYEGYRSPPVYAPRVPTVWVSPPGDIMKNSSVTLSCSSDANSPTVYTWYKNNQSLLRKEPQLVFSSIQSSDSGQYYCTAENDLGRRTSNFIFINVKYGPQTSTLSVSPSGETVEGSSVTLTCSSDANPAADYTWYKENQTLLQGPEDIYHFSSISSEDRGFYQCKSENQYGQISSEPLFLDVQYAPKLPSVSVSPSGEIVEGSSVTLTCSSDANPAADYTWYKEDEDSAKASGQIFIITNVTAEHSGSYYCEAQNSRGRNNSTLHLTVVTGKTVMILNIIRLTLVVLMLIPLCLSFFNLWMRKKEKSLSLNTEPKEAVEVMEMQLKQRQDSPDGSRKVVLIFTELRGATMSLTAAAGGFVVLLLTVPVVQGQDDWDVTYSPTELCAPKGSTVEIHITYRDPPTTHGYVPLVQKRLITESYAVDVDLNTDPAYSGRVDYPCYRSHGCTLRIRDLRESDSAEYRFRFIANRPGGKYLGSPGFTLFVTGDKLHIDVTPKFSDDPNLTELKCHIQCQQDVHHSYSWYKNGEKFREGEMYYHRGPFDPADKYHCAIDGQTFLYSLPVYAPNPPSVTVTPSGEIEEGRSVNLTCSSDANPPAKYTWLNINRNSKVQPVKEQSLLFLSIQSSNSGNYLCTAENDLGTIMSELTFIDVKYAPKLPSVSVSPSGEIVEGSSVTLTCSSDANPAADYTWYKENQTLLQGPEDIYHFSSISSEDRGFYQCKSENQYGQISSEPLFLDVQYAPKLPSVSVSPSAEIKEGSSVTLTCSSDANPAANYTWYKENQTLLQGPEGVYHFPSLSSEDSGFYHCKCENQYGHKNSSSLLVDVLYAPKLPSVSVSPSAEIKEGSSVTLTCSSDANPAANYTWYKINGNPELQPVNEASLSFSSIQSSDSGTYYCTAENDLGNNMSELSFIDVKYAPKLPSVSVSPSGEIVEGSSVTLTCSSDANPAASCTWYKENQTLLQGPEGVYHFPSLISEDRGFYHCKCVNQYGQINSSTLLIDVHYAPKLPSVSVSPSGEIVEGSSVTLTCSSDANPAANYTWYKENQTLLQGRAGIYHFSSISSEDRGFYRCKSKNQYGQTNFSSLLIDVHYAPKLPSVSVSPSAEIKEGSSVNLTCSSDANPAANYTWYKEDDDSAKASGQIFTITNIRAEHSGSYYCEAQNSRGRNNSTLRLTVRAVPSEAWKSAVSGIALLLVLAVIFLSVFLLMRKKRNSKQPPGPEETPDQQCPPNHAVEQDDLYYASIRFLKNQTDAVYSNIRTAGPFRKEEEDEEVEDTEYTVVKFNSSAPRTSGQESGEDPSALYSTVNKTF